MIRTLSGVVLAMMLSIALLASPCVLCFQPAKAAPGHDCCQKKQTKAPGDCGLHWADLASSETAKGKASVDVTMPDAVVVAVSAPVSIERPVVALAVTPVSPPSSITVLRV